MKKAVVFLIFISTFTSIYANSTLTIDDFKKLTIEDQAEYLNNLNKESIVSFLKELLIHNKNSFLELPNTELQFLKNGKILIYTYNYKYSKNEYHIAYWKIKNNKIIIWKKNPKLIFLGNKMEQELIFKNAEVEYSSKKIPDQLRINFENLYDLVFLNHYADSITWHFRNYKDK